MPLSSRDIDRIRYFVNQGDDLVYIFGGTLLVVLAGMWAYKRIAKLFLDDSGRHSRYDPHEDALLENNARDNAKQYASEMKQLRK